MFVYYEQNMSRKRYPVSSTQYTVHIAHVVVFAQKLCIQGLHDNIINKALNKKLCVLADRNIF